MHQQKEKNANRLLKAIKKLDLGDGITVSMGDGDDVSFFYTNRVEVPEGLPKGFQIEVSSCQKDDAEMLHYLLNRTRGQVETGKPSSE